MLGIRQALAISRSDEQQRRCGYPLQHVVVDAVLLLCAAHVGSEREGIIDSEGSRSLRIHRFAAPHAPTGQKSLDTAAFEYVDAAREEQCVERARHRSAAT